jgi:hypothetical protein
MLMGKEQRAHSGEMAAAALQLHESVGAEIDFQVVVQQRVGARAQVGSTTPSRFFTGRAYAKRRGPTFGGGRS